METAPRHLGLPFLGHTYALFKAVHTRPSTWDLFSVWGQKAGAVRPPPPAAAPLCTACPTGSLTWALESSQEPSRVQIFLQQCVLIADPALMKRVLQTNMSNYVKDIDFAYKPFMVCQTSRRARPAPARALVRGLERQHSPSLLFSRLDPSFIVATPSRFPPRMPTPQGILGSGLVTSEGDLWRKQRLLVSKAFRVEILDDILRIAHKATLRLARGPHAAPQRLPSTGPSAPALCRAPSSPPRPCGTPSLLRPWALPVPPSPRRTHCRLRPDPPLPNPDPG